MANNGVERYQFKCLEDMDRATKIAFGSHESSIIYFEKGLILCFMPVGSKIFDGNIRKKLTECGGVLIKE